MPSVDHDSKELVSANTIDEFFFCLPVTGVLTHSSPQIHCQCVPSDCFIDHSYTAWMSFWNSSAVLVVLT